MKQNLWNFVPKWSPYHSSVHRVIIVPGSNNVAQLLTKIQMLECCITLTAIPEVFFKKVCQALKTCVPSYYDKEGKGT